MWAICGWNAWTTARSGGRLTTMQTQAPLTASSRPSSVAPALLNMMTGYWISQAIYVAAKLGIADLMHIGSVRFETLAAASEVDPPSLYRLLRALASVGIFAETSP